MVSLVPTHMDVKAKVCPLWSFYSLVSNMPMEERERERERDEFILKVIHKGQVAIFYI